MQAVMADRGLAQQARLWWRALVLALLVLTIAGCQSVVPRGQQPRPTTPPPTTTGPGVVTPGLPTDAQRHRIALLVPQSGENAGVGQSIANMTQLAVLDSKNDRVRITTYDTSRGAAAAARAAIADGNKLILGPLLAVDVTAVGPIARAANVPILSFSNDTSVAGNGAFLLGYVPAQSVERVVEYAREKGHTRFAALVPQGAYGDRSLAAMRKALKDEGGTLVASETYDRTPTSVTGAIRRLSRGETYDAVLVADGGRVAVQAVPLLREGSGTRPQVLGTELWNTDSSLAGSPALRGAWFASVSDGLYNQLASKYRTRYGSVPYRLSALGYDAVLLTVRMARDWKPGTAFPVGKLFADDGFGGIDGIFRFDDLGVAQRSLEVSEVGAGGFRVIDAAPAKW